MKRLNKISLITLFMLMTAVLLCTGAIAMAAQDTAEEATAPVAVAAKTSSKKHDPDMLKVTLISLGISIVGTGIFAFTTYNSYKHNGKTEPYKYNEKIHTNMHRTRDELINREVTSRRIERNNDRN